MDIYRANEVREKVEDNRYSKIDSFLDSILTPSTIREGNGYVLGRYNEGVATNGYYLTPQKGSIADRVMTLAKKKFMLEMDAENFASLALLELYLSLIKFYNKGLLNDSMDIKDFQGLAYTNVQFKLRDVAKLGKQTMYSTCDRSHGKDEFIINKIESWEVKFLINKDYVKNLKDERYISKLYGQQVDEENVKRNPFVEWLHENMHSFLTEREIDIVVGDYLGTPPKHQRDRIYKKVMAVWDKEQTKLGKIEKLQTRLDIIQDILDSVDEKEMNNKLTRYDQSCEVWLANYIFENLNMYECKYMTNILNEEDNNIPKSFYYNLIEILIKKEKEFIKAISNVNRI